ncbi:MAG: hypothetical protein EA393_09975 [Bacteroidetes bacterium]|nr:MAG: hypothetical protein EA393_09975 [Bacteroidota bacterium]
MLQMGTTGPAVSELSYMGSSADNVPKTALKSSGFNFTPGDDLRFTGYVTDIAGNMDYGVIDDAPEASTEYLFDIANTPPDQPSEISGEIDVPENATGLVYEVDETAGLTYLWTVPDGWEITHGQGSHVIIVNVGSEGGEITVKAENDCGISEAKVLFVDLNSTVTDIDGNVYRTVIIGDQEWMAENLRVTHDASGNDITRYCYDNDETNCELYGGLYTWHTVMNGQSGSNNNPSGVQGICPAGWHVPSVEEWTELINYVAAQGYPNINNLQHGAGNALKSCRQVESPLGGECDTSEHPRWNSNLSNFGFDEFGFSALPGGWYSSTGRSIGNRSDWWTSTDLTSTLSWNIATSSASSSFGIINRHFSSGFSLRCVRIVPCCNLSLKVKPSGSGGATGSGGYEAGEEVSISAIANEGWAFYNWTGDTEYLDDHNEVNAIVTMPSYNITLTANFQIEHFPDIIYGDGVTDIDGNEYTTVIIGNQEWMAENLRVSRYNNEDSILTGLNIAEWSNTTEGAFAIYPHANINGLNSDAEVVSAYGKLYNWYAVDDPRYLCPDGWDMPRDTDWTQLVDYVVNQGFPNEFNIQNGAGNALKSCRQVGSPMGGACNTSEHPRWEFTFTSHGFDEFGFSALPGSFRNSGGSFSSIGGASYWWSATQSGCTNAWSRAIMGAGAIFRDDHFNMNNGLNIRCFRDINDSTSLRLNLNISPSCTGNVTGAGKYEVGEEVSITAVANGGWAFLNWTGDTEHVDDINAANTIVTMPNDDVTLTANFQVNVGPGIIYGDGVTDIDGNEYTSVIIGEQEWMAENLRVSKYNNGDSIPTGLNNSEWINTTEGAFSIYNNDETLLEAYGKLYNWYAVDDERGLCPVGWYVPSEDEWAELLNYAQAQGFPNNNITNGVGNALKSCRQIASPLGDDCETSEHPKWLSHITHYGFDEFGFSALPGGYRGSNIGSDLSKRGIWWSSTEISSESALSRRVTILHNYSYVVPSNASKLFGFSLRCVKDND